MTKSVLLAASCAAALWTGAANAQPATPATGVEVPPTPHYGTWGFDAAGENKAILPGNDFFGFTDGTAVSQIVIPQDRSNYGAFAQLAVLSEARVHAILEQAAAGAPPGPPPRPRRSGPSTAPSWTRRGRTAWGRRP